MLYLICFFFFFLFFLESIQKTRKSLETKKKKKKPEVHWTQFLFAESKCLKNNKNNHNVFFFFFFFFNIYLSPFSQPNRAYKSNSFLFLFPFQITSLRDEYEKYWKNTTPHHTPPQVLVLLKRRKKKINFLLITPTDTVIDYCYSNLPTYLWCFLFY